MTPSRLFALSLALALVAFNAEAGGPPPLGITTDNCRIVKIVDGDTLDVLVTYKVRVRLAGCWSPEKNTAAGEKAWEELEAYCGGKECTLFIPTSNARSAADVLTLNRVVGRVWPKGAEKCLSEWQVSKGNATREKPR
jgi:endonuclease YncB( thermonuclease family)